MGGLGTGSETTLHTYEDAEEGFRGFLAFAGSGHSLAAGGFRVQAGLTGETIAALAEAMRLKEKVLQLGVDGAKCGIDYDPLAPGKHAAMRRFLRWLRPHLDGRLSLGPDMGTTFSEIESLARPEGIASVKAAIARAQGLPRDQVLRRLLTLDARVGGLTVGERRAGHALAHATFAAARRAGRGGPALTCAVQGFGTLARGALATMREAGVRVVSVADEHGSVTREQGLELAELLALPHRAPVVGHAGAGAVRGARGAVVEAPVDVLVLAACEDALAPADAERVRAPVVVVGANNGLRSEVERALHARGVVVVPDFVGGAGGSAAMDALFAPALCPDAVTVLARVALIARTLVERVLEAAERDGVAPRAAALAIAESYAPEAGARPYGLRLLESIEQARATPTCVALRAA
jgi:glutamate dehydrogenase (NAD(P)+)